MLYVKRLLVIICCMAAPAFGVSLLTGSGNDVYKQGSSIGTPLNFGNTATGATAKGLTPTLAVAGTIGTSPEQDSSTLLPKITPEPTPTIKIANLMYVTFQLPTGSQNAFQGGCPDGMTYVSGSGTVVPAIPGYAPAAMYYWQCIENVNGWSQAPVGNSIGAAQPFIAPSYTDITYAGTLQGAAAPQLYHSQGVYAQSPPVNWMVDLVDDTSGQTNYTYYQFPGNNFIPSGIGGSGIGCNTNHGDVLTIVCKDAFGRTIQTSPNAQNGITPVSPVIFFIPSGSSATCSVTRTYPGEYPTCTGTVTVPSGQTKVMACCNGNFACGTSTWSDASLTTCLSCPKTVQCN
jgi:hypothetical protein